MSNSSRLALSCLKLTPESQGLDLPLIAVPRLLTKLYGARRSTKVSQQRGGTEKADGILDIIRRLTTSCLFDFSPELVASSIVDLWRDLSTEEARVDFLRYHKGWIGHAVLNSSFEAKGAAS